MLKRLICCLLGHHVMHRAFTGEVKKMTMAGDMYPSDVPIYRMERQTYCRRCGIEVPR